MIKKVITCGCSFTDTEYAWDRVLENHFLQFNQEIEFEFLGLGSQGNELIQKKTSLAIVESLKKYKADEILVIVMWSGTERKTFYYNNPEEIEKLIDFWNNTKYWGYQFFDLKNKLGKNHKKVLIEQNFSQFPVVNEYDLDGGWVNFNFLFDTTGLAKEYFNATKDKVHAVHVSLENIIMLQNLCKMHNIKFFQQFYRDYVYEDIIENKDHQIVNYLYDLLDHSTFILDRGMYEYLKNSKTDTKNFDRWGFLGIHKEHEYFDSGHHPNKKGHEVWTKNVIIPFLEKNNICTK